MIHSVSSVKTSAAQRPSSILRFDYQSDRHCSKTRVLKNGVVEANNEIERKVKEANPDITEADEIARKTQDAFYRENEKQKWFKIIKK